jgi:hypothetical protein
MEINHLLTSAAIILLVVTSGTPGYAAGNCLPVIHQPPRIGEKFRFEDYQDEGKLRRKLLELYPIGSSYKKMAAEMKKITCIKCSESDALGLDCTYLVSTYVVTGHSWSVKVSRIKDKITKSSVYKAPLAL